MKLKRISIIMAILMISMNAASVTSLAAPREPEAQSIMDILFGEKRDSGRRASESYEGDYLWMDVSTSLGPWVTVGNNDPSIPRYVKAEHRAFDAGGKRVASTSNSGVVTTGSKTAWSSDCDDFEYVEGKGTIRDGDTASASVLERHTMEVYK